MTGPSYLFAYGTLMPTAHGSFGHAERLRLSACVRSLGAATMRGQLYDLGDFPAMIEHGREAEIVHGEVLQLTCDADTVFSWLDAYEGIGLSQVSNDYERVMRAAQLTDGRTLEAWVYLYLGDVGSGRAIGDGRWMPRVG